MSHDIPPYQIFYHIAYLLATSPTCACEETMAAKRARLRRFCERKPSGKLQCPQWLHEQWKGNTNRDELLEQFEKCGWDKECLTTVMSQLQCYFC
jgi:hypothetical protein